MTTRQFLGCAALLLCTATLPLSAAGADVADAAMRADVATVPPATLKALVKHPLTDKGLEAFLTDWAKTGQKIG